MMALLLQHKDIFITSFREKLIISNSKECYNKCITIPEATCDKKGILQDDIKVISMCFAKSKDLFCVITNKKQLLLYDKHFNLIKNITLNRVASKIRFTPRNDIVVADKSGDAYLYKLNNDCNDKEELLLGHLSMLLDVLVTSCNKYIITCDRDEKIRVSCYPNAYNIVTFCLGHKEFVTNIELHGEVLISASGDGTIKLWDYLKGKLIDSIDTNQFIDVNLKDKFTEEMDKENVEITALPIKNMQVALLENRFIIVTSLLNYDGLLVFEVHNNKVKYIQTILSDACIIAFSLDSLLILLANNKFSCYSFKNSKFVVEDCSSLNSTLKEHNLNIVPDNNSVTVLYKRKYDNVQEYLERKKQRLEGS